MKTPTQQYEPEAIDLSDTEYTVEQTGTDKNMRPEYEAKDPTGDTIFSGLYEMYQTKDAFTFADADGNELFTVTASGTLDIAGDYILTDSHTGEDLVVLENDFSLLQDTWRVRDADDESLLAEITSRGGLVTVGRKLLPFGQWIGHRYEITDAEGDAVGSIESGFAILDEYEITVSDTSSVPIAPIVVGTIVVDGIQAN
jgi:uncharacterized protein YxjI